MGQFAVYRNPGRTKAAVPFVLDVQSSRWEDQPDRIVAPLVLAGTISYHDWTLNPAFTIAGVTVVMNPLQLAAIPARILGPAVGSLDHEHTRIIAALDALIAQGR